jgi:hypothetical protein
MDSTAALDLDVQLALKHIDSDDVFMQLLSIDSALQALKAAKKTFKPQPGILDGHDVASKHEDVQQHVDEVDTLIRRFEEL